MHFDASTITFQFFFYSKCLLDFYIFFTLRVSVVYKRRDTKFEMKYMVFGAKSPEGEDFIVKVGLVIAVNDYACCLCSLSTCSCIII